MAGKWEELLTNIEDREFGREAFKLRKLFGNQSEKLMWNPKSLGKPYLVGKGVYRFYVAFSAGESDEEKFRSAVSETLDRKWVNTTSNLYSRPHLS